MTEKKPGKSPKDEVKSAGMSGRRGKFPSIRNLNGMTESINKGVTGYSAKELGKLKDHMQKQKQHCCSGVVNQVAQGQQNRRAFKVLSLDGGGIRGLASLQVLKEIEKEMGKPIGQCFDLIIGNSTGGIIALGLNMPDPDNPDKPLYRAADLERFYNEEGPKIFGRCIFRRAWDKVSVLFRSHYIYSGKPLRNALHKYFGNTTVQQGVTNAQVTAYEMTCGRHFYFRNRFNPVRRAKDYNFTNVDAAMATSAAPTYFPGAESCSKPCVNGHDFPPTRFGFMDGGIYANNPALIGAIEAEKLIAGRDMDIVVVSVGTGAMDPCIEPKKYNKLGKLGLANMLFSHVVNAQSKQADDQLRDLMGADYVRFDKQIPAGVSTDFDDASRKNRAALTAFGRRIVDDARRDGSFNAVINFLKQDLAHGPIDHLQAVTSTAFVDPDDLAKYRRTGDFHNCFGNFSPPGGGAGNGGSAPAASSGGKSAKGKKPELKNKRKPKSGTSKSKSGKPKAQGKKPAKPASKSKCNPKGPSAPKQ